MKKYCITYRREFGIEVRAETKEDAFREMQKYDKWTLLSELHPDFLEIEKVEEIESIDKKNEY
jgi:hypothetical protein